MSTWLVFVQWCTRQCLIYRSFLSRSQKSQKKEKRQDKDVKMHNKLSYQLGQWTFGISPSYENCWCPPQAETCLPPARMHLYYLCTEMCFCTICLHFTICALRCVVCFQKYIKSHSIPHFPLTVLKKSNVSRFTSHSLSFVQMYNFCSSSWCE